jgi:hypothetical protein
MGRSPGNARSVAGDGRVDSWSLGVQTVAVVSLIFLSQACEARLEDLETFSQGSLPF